MEKGMNYLNQASQSLILNEIKVNNIKEPDIVHGVKIKQIFGGTILVDESVKERHDVVVETDEIIENLGARTFDYATKTTCCGNSMITKEKDMSLDMIKDKIVDLKKNGADMMTVCCPSCFLQYDKNQLLLRSKGVDHKIPVIPVLQLLGIAWGLSPEDVYIKNNRSVGPDMVSWLRGEN